LGASTEVTELASVFSGLTSSTLTPRAGSVDRQHRKPGGFAQDVHCTHRIVGKEVIAELALIRLLALGHNALTVPSAPEIPAAKFDRGGMLPTPPYGGTRGPVKMELG